MKSLKHQLFALFVLVMFVSFPVHVADALTISDVRVLPVHANSVRVEWTTDTNANSIVNYTRGSEIFSLAQTSNTTNHSIRLQRLERNTLYSAIAVSCDANGCVTSDPEIFTTDGVNVGTPNVTVQIPRHVDTPVIDIRGPVPAGAIVRLFVNNLDVPVRLLSSAETASGSFEFRNVNLLPENVIKIEFENLAGEVDAKNFRVSVDTTPPELITENITGTTRESNVSIAGVVDEEVVIEAFVFNAGTRPLAPPQVVGLSGVQDAGTVELEWDFQDVDDFSHYIIYRDDVAIAKNQPDNLITYTDILVNKGQTYQYQVSIVNRFGEEGPRSAPTVVEVLDGFTGVPAPQPLLNPTFVAPQNPANVSGTFSYRVDLPGEGRYDILLRARDRAGNVQERSFFTIFDRTPPVLDITSPRTGSLVYETYAREVEISGQTDPFAKVFLYIGRTPIGPFNRSVRIDVLNTEIEQFSAADLAADCDFLRQSINRCGANADYEVTADANGLFDFDDVNIDARLQARFAIGDIPPEDLRLRDQFRQSREIDLLFIAEDSAGLRSIVDYDLRVGTCFSGNQSFNVVPLTQYQSPAFLSSQRLSENRENIYFYNEFEYVGRGVNSEITSISVASGCGHNAVFQDDRFNISCELLSARPGSAPVDEEKTIWQFSSALDRLDGMDRFLDFDWKDFGEAVNNEVTFPLVYRISYVHNVNGRQIRETQTTCEEVTYVLDNTLIDPRDVLPDWLLFDAVDFLNESIQTVDEINDQIDKVIEFLAIGCVTSFTARLGTQIYRRIVSATEQKKAALDAVFSVVSGSADDKYCADLMENLVAATENTPNEIEKDHEEKKDGTVTRVIKFLGFDIDMVSDRDLERCFPKTAKAWRAEEKVYQAYRLTCDRLFGHATPSRWTENRADDELRQARQASGFCGIDETVRSQGLVAINCRELQRSLSGNRYNTGLQADFRERTFAVDDVCIEVINPIVANNARVRSIFKIEGKFDDNEIYRATKEIGLLDREEIFVQKVNDRTYLTAQPRTCEQICGTGNTAEPRACQTVNSCLELRANGQPTTLEGYATDCFYDAGRKDETVVSPDRRFQQQCCCKDGSALDVEQYYQYDDTTLYDDPNLGAPAPAFKSKSTPDPSPDDPVQPTSFEDMQWSYRYDQIEYATAGDELTRFLEVHTEYNPDRYVKGRDFAACFGQNNLLYDVPAPPDNEAGDLLVIDSRQQFTSAFQCANIGGIKNRLALFNNFQKALQNCLLDVRATGTSDSAVCRELFTRYVCSTLWQVISFFTADSCSIEGGRINYDSADQYGNAFTNSLSAVTETLSDAQTELSEEYGNAELNNLLGAGQGGIARKACLAAFGYDWDVDINSIVDASYAQTTASLVQATSSKREFLSFDPRTGQSTYDYNGAWIINAGCKLDSYSVDLVCVNRDDAFSNSGFVDGGSIPRAGFFRPGIRCDEVNSPDGSNCDCLNADNLDQSFRKRSLFQGRRVDQNEFIQAGEVEAVPSAYRYDHLKFTLRPSRELTRELQASCFPPGHEDGVFYFPIRDVTPTDIADCAVDITTGRFGCGSGLGLLPSVTTAQVNRVLVNGLDVDNQLDRRIELRSGDELSIEPIITKTPGTAPLCLIVNLQRGNIASREFSIPVDVDGINNYGNRILLENAQSARESNLNSGLLAESEMRECRIQKDDNSIERGTRECPVLGANQPSVRVNFENMALADRTEFTIKFIDASNDGIKFGDEDTFEVTLSSGGTTLITRTFNLEERDNTGTSVVYSMDAERIRFTLSNLDFPLRIRDVLFRKQVRPEQVIDREQQWTLRYSLHALKRPDGVCTNRADYHADAVTFQGQRQQDTISVRYLPTSATVDLDRPRTGTDPGAGSSSRPSLPPAASAGPTTGLTTFQVADRVAAEFANNDRTTYSYLMAFAEQESAFTHCNENFGPPVPGSTNRRGGGEIESCTGDEVLGVSPGELGAMQLFQAQHCAWFDRELCDQLDDGLADDGGEFPNWCVDSYTMSSLRQDCQIMDDAGCAAGTDAYDRECNIRTGMKFAQSNSNGGPQTYCSTATYSGWEFAARSYNGWGCGAGANANYVGEVNSKRSKYSVSNTRIYSSLQQMEEGLSAAAGSQPATGAASSDDPIEFFASYQLLDAAGNRRIGSPPIPSSINEIASEVEPAILNYDELRHGDAYEIFIYVDGLGNRNIEIIQEVTSISSSTISCENSQCKVPSNILVRQTNGPVTFHDFTVRFSHPEFGSEQRFARVYAVLPEETGAPTQPTLPDMDLPDFDGFAQLFYSIEGRTSDGRIVYTTYRDEADVGTRAQQPDPVSFSFDLSAQGLPRANNEFLLVGIPGLGNGVIQVIQGGSPNSNSFILGCNNDICEIPTSRLNVVPDGPTSNAHSIQVWFVHPQLDATQHLSLLRGTFPN